LPQQNPIRLVKLLIKARRFNATLVGSDGEPFAALAKRQGVSPSYFTRLVRLSYLAPDITEAILDGRQPLDLTADKLLAHSRLPLDWHEQRTALGFARAIRGNAQRISARHEQRACCGPVSSLSPNRAGGIAVLE
jgi:hypothetical protein